MVLKKAPAAYIERVAVRELEATFDSTDRSPGRFAMP
jgi:hypothetical protein